MNPQILESGAKLTPFLLPAPAKIGILVVPGGGYSGLATGHEGRDIAAWLNARGYDAWMLEYTTTSLSKAPLYPKPQNDALQALRFIRAQNRVQKLGIWGFSAGGHLAATVVTNPETRDAKQKLDFAILAYPVISMEFGVTHGGSRANLLGNAPDPALEKALSAQNRVSLETPPVFLFHTADDNVVPVENALLFSHALASHRVPFEVHVYENGPHGVGLAPGDKILSTWSARLEDWLQKR
ncbi:alpha/beta hydrolase [Abditibacterium utsteinense]|nr:alpha/beta hydrolase [Abditibacterium utsteinense]